jgi:uncharacterized protein (DUF924 family)
MKYSNEIIDFWFSEEVKPKWFIQDPEFDQQITEKFLDLYEEAKQAFLESTNPDFEEKTPEDFLAKIILFDQFPRNMFRGDKRAYETDFYARMLSSIAILRLQHTHLDPEKRKFIYMPLMHAEAIQAQHSSVMLFEEMEDEEFLKWARHHRDIIVRFGRFPHRNEILGRESTEREREFLLNMRTSK